MSIWLRAPLLRLCLFFISGIIAQEYSSQSENNLWVLLLLLVALLPLVIRKTSYLQRHINGLSICLVFLLMGCMVKASHEKTDTKYHFKNWICSDSFLAGYILSPPDLKKRSFSFDMEVTMISCQDEWQNTVGYIRCYLQRDSSNQTCLYSLGDFVQIQGQIQPISPPQNPGSFDYRLYMARKDIGHQIFCKKESSILLAKNTHFKATEKLSQCRTYLLENFKMYLNPREFGVISALSLGEKEFLEKEISNKYQAAGTMHLLAVSGLHVGLIYMVLIQLFGWTKRWKFGRIVSVIIILVVLWLYAGLAGASPSVLRATTMFSFLSLGGLFSKKANSYNLLAASAVCILVIDPELLFSVGFQLSYAAVFAILFIQPSIARMWQPNNRILNYFWQLASVSIAAQIGTFPLSIFYFHTFPTYFLVANIIVIPLATVVLYSSLLFYLLLYLEIGHVFVASLTQMLCWCLNEIVSAIDKLPHSQFSSLYIALSAVAVFYLVIYSLFSWIGTRKHIWLLVALTGVLFLSIHSYIGAWKKRHQQYVVIHHIRDQSAMSIILGNQAFIYCSKKDVGPGSPLSYATNGWFLSRQIDRTSVSQLGFQPESRTELIFEEMRISCIHAHCQHEIPPSSSTMFWAIDEPEINWSMWRNFEPAKLMIADGSCSRHWVEQNRDKAAQVGVILHSTLESGAWIAGN